MPTLLIKNGFKFFFYANEHEPVHIHVLKAEEFAKINLETLNVEKNHMKPVNLKNALIIARFHQKEFRRKWNEFFSKR